MIAKTPPKIKYVHIPEGNYCGEDALAIAAGCVRRNITEMMARGTIKSIRIYKRGRIIPEKAAEKYLEDHRQRVLEAKK